MGSENDLYQVCCLVGTPSDELWKEWLKWVEKMSYHRLVIVSPYPDLMQRFSKERVSFYWANSVDSPVFVQIAYQYLHAALEIIPVTEEDHAQCAVLEAAVLEMNAWAGQFKEKGLDLLGNILQNMRLSDQFLDATAMEKPFAGVPAIICGAGPSLNIDLLKKLQKKGLVFAGGATLGVLLQNGITPHFGGMIDANPEHVSVQGMSQAEFPLFFQLRCSHFVLHKYTGPKLWWPSSDALPLENNLVASLKEEKVPVFDGGWTVSTFLLSVARELGCSPITTMGCDHILKDGKKYPHVEDGFGGNKEEPLEWVFARKWLDQMPIAAPESLLDYPIKNGVDIVKKFLMQLPKLHQRSDNPETLVDSFLDSFAALGKYAEGLLGLLENFYPNFPDQDSVYQQKKESLEKEWAYQDFCLNVWCVWESYFVRLVEGEKISQKFGLEVHKYLFLLNLSKQAAKFREVGCSNDAVV